MVFGILPLPPPPPKGPLDTGCTSLLIHIHLELITCYFLNLFISYQPVTCCLNTSSSCGCQGFLSGRRNQISIVSIFSLLSAFPTAVARVGCEAGTVKPPQGCRGDTCSRAPPQGSQQGTGTLGLVINFHVISIGFAQPNSPCRLFLAISTLDFYFCFPKGCHVFLFPPSLSPTHSS